MEMPFSSALTQSGQFFAWWAGELRDLIPGRAGDQAARKSSQFTVFVEDTGFTLDEATEAPSGLTPAARQHFDDRPELMQALEELAKTKHIGEVAIRLPQTACFVRRIEVPEAAVSEAHRFLALDLERNSPFKLAEIRTAHHIDASRPRAGKVMMHQYIVKRATIDPLVEEIEAHGLDVAHVDCWMSDGVTPAPIDFLAYGRDRQDGNRTSRLLTSAMVAAVLASGASAAYVYADRYQGELQTLEAQNASLKARARTAREAAAKAEERQASGQALKKARADYAYRTQALDELTRLLPDTTWVHDLRFEGANVDFSGLSTSASNIVRTLERSRTFTDATMTSPITFDQREDKERYSIRVHLRGQDEKPSDKPKTEAE